MKKSNTINVLVYKIHLVTMGTEYIGYEHEYEVGITSGIDYLTKQEAKEALVEHFKPDLVIEAKDFDPVNFIVPAEQPQEDDVDWGIERRHRYAVIAGDIAMVFLRAEKEYNPFKNILRDDVEINKYYADRRKKCLDAYEDLHQNKLITEVAENADNIFIKYCVKQLGDVFESGSDIVDKGYIDQDVSTYPEKIINKNNANYVRYCKLAIINNAMQIGEEQNDVDIPWHYEILSETFVKAYNENRLTEKQKEWLTEKIDENTTLYMTKEYHNYKED